MMSIRSYTKEFAIKLLVPTSKNSSLTLRSNVSGRIYKREPNSTPKKVHTIFSLEGLIESMAKNEGFQLSKT